MQNCKSFAAVYKMDLNVSFENVWLIFTPIEELNSLIYGMLLYVNIYGSHRL